MVSPTVIETRQSQPAVNSSEARAQTTRADGDKDAWTARFSTWVRHEDEFVSLLIPDDPRVRLEIKTPEDPISVAGGPVRSSGISFFRCYRLTFNGETYCLLLLDRRAEFDDSICFCGHVACEKYMEHQGALYRFSLLRNGMIKKIQLLGEGLRLVLFEWTHMPISQEVYAQIALGARWRHPPRDLRSLTATIQEAYGKVGFLEPGMDRNAVVALLGPPTSEDRQRLRYVIRRSHDEPPGSDIEEVTWTIPLKDGKFECLSPDWEQRRRLPPERNSVQWIVARLEGQQRKSDSVPLARDDELQPLLARVVQLLPRARESHWSHLCYATALLAKRHVKDPRALEIIKQQYLDPERFASEASEALYQYDAEGCQELFVKRIRLEMSLARRPEEIKKQMDDGLGWLSLQQLFGCLRQTHPERNALILEAMDHPHVGVRIDGYERWDDLPEPVARLRLRKGFGDSSPYIRAASAEALPMIRATEAESAEDVAVLRAQLAKEQDEDVVRVIKDAIRELE